MTEVNSIALAPAKAAKPEKPSDDYPLFAHATGRWAKKINGRTVYFGVWADPDGALAAFHSFLDGKTKAAEQPAPAPKNGKGARPKKPYADFPLFPHASGRWAKKIRGTLAYFGKWCDGWEAAMKKYQEQAADLHAGKTPREKLDRLTVRGLCEKFLTAKATKRDEGELTHRSFIDYARTAKLLIKEFGKNRLLTDLGPADFEKLRAAIARKWGPVRCGTEVGRVRIVFNFAVKGGLIEKPMVYGEFNRTSQKVLRRHRKGQDAKLFTAPEIRAMLAAASPTMKAMILLGVNCGFGNADVGRLPLSALDLDGAWATFARPKTGVDRRCPLWPETVEAIKASLAVRPAPVDKANDGLAFITVKGLPWHRETTPDSPVSHAMRKLMTACGLDGHRGFYCLRHVFQTVGDESLDFLGVRTIMGHVDAADIANHYREGASDERLLRVTNHVHDWLFAETAVTGCQADE